MTLITLLLVLTIERIAATSDIWQFPFYYQKLKGLFLRHIGKSEWLDNPLGRTLWLLLPVIVIQFLAASLDWLLLSLAFDILVLLICIGCIKQRKVYKSLLNSVNRGDEEAAALYGAELLDSVAEPKPPADKPVSQQTLAEDEAQAQSSDTTEQAPVSEMSTTADAAESNQQLAESEVQTATEQAAVVDEPEAKASDNVADSDSSSSTAQNNSADDVQESPQQPQADITPVDLGLTLVWINFRYYAAVLFWFVCLGPAGAVLYCMVRETADERDEQVSGGKRQRHWQTILHWFDWLPARICSAGYLLIGNFNQAAGVWLSYLLDFASPARSLIVDSAKAAEPVHEMQCGKADAATCMLKLAKRNVLFFLALVALLTLSGWLS